MKISSIGIMQGRILPKFVDRLQVFPIDTWEEELVATENIGFQHIELLWDSKQDIKKAKGLMNNVSELPQLHAPSMCIDSICNYTSAKDILNEILDVLDTFKQDTPGILVVPLLGKATINTIFKLKELIDKIGAHKIWNLLQKYNVKLALELDMPSSEIIKAIEFSNPNLIGICLDSGNLWHYSNNPIEDMQILSNRIIHVHIKDRDKTGENVLLGDGLVDFHKFSKVLKDIGYSDLITLETKYFKSPSSEAKKNLEYISEIIQFS